MIIYCDSSTKQACVVIEGNLPEITTYPNSVTNNEGEYHALILALEKASRTPNVFFEILTDSQLVVEQVNEHWACRKKRLQVLRHKVWELARNLDCEIRWIPREENLAGKVLG